MDEKEPVWHRETVDAGVEPTLRDLHNVPILTSFYLAGETGLALRLSHRRSVYLDFFHGENFNEDSVLQKLQHLEGFVLAAKERLPFSTRLSLARYSRFERTDIPCDLLRLAAFHHFQVIARLQVQPERG